MSTDAGKPSGWTPYKPSIWGTRARRLVEQALDEVTDGTDAIGTLEAAIAALRIEAKELPESEMDGYPFPGEPVDDESRCCQLCCDASAQYERERRAGKVA